MENCNICFCDLEDPYAFPACNHRFCRSCLKENFEQKIKNMEVDISGFVCPNMECQKPFDISLLRHFLTPASYLKYAEFAIISNSIYGLGKDEVMVKCLSKNCENKLIIWKDADYQSCYLCKKKHCRKCFLESHPEYTCEEAQEIERINNPINNEELNYQEMKKSVGIGRCPHCGIMAQKISGCNYMTCGSIFCKSAKYYCYLCDTKLVEKDHFSHFENNDPFNSPCRVDVNGVWKDRKDAPEVVAAQEAEKQRRIKEGQDKLKQQIPKPKPVVKQVQNNLIACPGCGSKDSTITDIMLEGNLVFCKSADCQEARFCVQCQERLDEGDIGEHFDLQFRCKML